MQPGQRIDGLERVVLSIQNPTAFNKPPAQKELIKL